MAADGVSVPEQAANRTLPRWLLSRLNPSEFKSSSRPDMILVMPSSNSPKDQDMVSPSHIPKDKRDIHLVELKYCEDTRPEGQLARATDPSVNCEVAI